MLNMRKPTQRLEFVPKDTELVGRECLHWNPGG